MKRSIPLLFTGMCSFTLLAFQTSADEVNVPVPWRTSKPNNLVYYPTIPAFQFPQHIRFTCPRWAVEKQGSFDLTVDETTYNFSMTDSLELLATGRSFKIKQRPTSPDSGPACSWRTIDNETLIGTTINIDARNANRSPKLAVQFQKRRMFKIESALNNFSCGNDEQIFFFIDRNNSSSPDHRQINLLNGVGAITYGKTIHVQYSKDCPDFQNKYPNAQITILK